jgi:methionyl-tRNA formyltransferase
MPKRIKIIYIGTPEIAVPPLQKIINNDLFEISAVITQPDKPAGRKKVMTPPPVKILALKHRLNVLQPQKISEITKEIASISPDIMVVMAYAQLLPQSLLSIPKYGAINIHTSLLPKYRGASPIQAAIMNGDIETGITYMLMDTGLDTGPILLELKEAIRQDDTTATLSTRLSSLAAENISKIINDYIEGIIQPQKQNDSKSSFVQEFKKEDGHINWSLPSKKIEQFIRAMFPWPVSFTFVDDIMIKIFSTQIVNDKSNGLSQGEITVYGKSFAIKTLDGLIVLGNIQPAGKKIMDSKDYLLGNPAIIGKIAQ